VKKLFLLFVFVAACAPLGENQAEKYQPEMKLIVQSMAVDGHTVDARELGAVEVIELPIDELREHCKRNAYGCTTSYVSGVTILLPDARAWACTGEPGSRKGHGCWYTQGEIALHEYTHAAYRQLGIDTGDHPDFFYKTLKRAYDEWDLWDHPDEE
jgi:hypothetical protein